MNTSEKQPIGLQLILKHPDKIPIIIHFRNLTTIDKKTVQKMMIPNDKTTAFLISEIRKRTNIHAKDALYIFIENIIPMNGASIDDLYHRYKSEEDHCLHIVATTENTFG